MNGYNELSPTGKAEFDGVMKANNLVEFSAIPANWYSQMFSTITSIKNEELSNANP